MQTELQVIHNFVERFTTEKLKYSPKLILKEFLEIIESIDKSTQTSVENILNRKPGELWISIFKVLVYPYFMCMHDTFRIEIENYGMLIHSRPTFDTESDSNYYDMYVPYVYHICETEVNKLC